MDARINRSVSDILSIEAVREKRQLAVFLGIVILYLALAIVVALTIRPWSDDGWFAAPAFNLITTGSMGTPVLEPDGWLRGIDKHTYWVMPLNILIQAAWYKVFGFGLFSMRAMTICGGLSALGSWLFIVRRLTHDTKVALLTTLFLGVDYFFVTLSSSGRIVDILCMAFGSAGIAAYLWLREDRFKLAVLVSHTLVVASGLTHWMGVLWLIGLIFVTLYYDRRRVKWQHVALAAVPYLIGATGWGLYILQNPADFLVQFRGNAVTDNRLRALTEPWVGFVGEATLRYRYAYGLGPHSAGHGPIVALKVVILIAYLLGVFGAVSTRPIRQDKGHRTLMIMTALSFVVMAVLDGQKLVCYLIHIIPLYAALLAIWLKWCWTARFVPKWVAAGFICGLVLLQMGAAFKRAAINSYQNSYLPAAEFLKSRMTPDSLVMGAADLGFTLGFGKNLIDDRYLGYYSGKRPDFIVVEESYEEAFDGNRKHRPEVYKHVTELMAREYREVYNHAFYRIYARIQTPLASRRRQ